MLRTRLWMGAVLIALVAGVLVVDQALAPWFPFLFVVLAGLAAALIYHEVSGSMLTIAWGLEGVALLGAGFQLRDRVLRLAGLAMLIGCIGKLFMWDLRNLDTLPRIFSFVILGALLVQAITSAPRCLARMTQPVPTPPLAPRMSTRSPFFTVACVISMRCAVP